MTNFKNKNTFLRNCVAIWTRPTSTVQNIILSERSFYVYLSISIIALFLFPTIKPQLIKIVNNYNYEGSFFVYIFKYMVGFIMRLFIFGFILFNGISYIYYKLGKTILKGTSSFKRMRYALSAIFLAFVLMYPIFTGFLYGLIKIFGAEVMFDEHSILRYTISIVFFCWLFWLILICISEAHNLSKHKSALLVFLPYIICMIIALMFRV